MKKYIITILVLTGLMATSLAASQFHKKVEKKTAATSCKKHPKHHTKKSKEKNHKGKVCLSCS